MSHQWLKQNITNTHWKVVGTVDYEDKTKRKFYVTKMIGILEKNGFLTKTNTIKSTSDSTEYVEILAKRKPLNKYKAVAWVHPKSGGDDYSVDIDTFAENLTVAKKQVRNHLLNKLHTRPLMANAFTIKKVNKK